MGVYYSWVNMDRREFIQCGDFDDSRCKLYQTIWYTDLEAAYNESAINDLEEYVKARIGIVSDFDVRNEINQGHTSQKKISPALRYRVELWLKYI